MPQFHYIAVVIVPIALLFTKLSFYLLYHQLFHHLQHLRWAIYAGAAITTGFYIANSVSHFIFVTPRKGQTVNSTLSQNLEQVKELGFALGIFGIISDFYILLLPITGLIPLRMAWRRKMGVMIIFMTGLLYALFFLMIISKIC